MPSIYDLKPKFQNLLRPASRALERAGVTANAVTVTACFSLPWPGKKTEFMQTLTERMAGLRRQCEAALPGDQQPV